MKLPKMIGAHVPKKPATRRPRVRISESAEMFNRSFDAWAKRATRSHLSYQRDPL